MKKQFAKVKLGLLGFLLPLAPFKVFAKEIVPDNLYDSYAMTYVAGKERLSQFTSKVWFGDDWFGLSAEMLYLINSFVQAVFWVTKSIFYICAGLYEYLSDLSAFDYYVVTAVAKSVKVFEGLKVQFLPAVGISMVAYLMYVFFVKNGSFVKTLLKLLVTFACAGVLFGHYNGKYVIKHVYDGMTIMTDEVAEKTFKGISFGEEKLTAKKAFTGQGKSVVLDKYFDIAIWKPYQYLNGDVTDSKNGDVSFIFSDEEYIALLDYDSGDDGFKLNGESIKEVVGTNKEPKNRMMKASWGSKFTYAFSSLIDAFVLGTILDVFAVTAFAMRLMIILLIIVGAFVAVIAMFPTMDNVLINFIKSMGMNLAISGLMSFFALIILWFYDVLSDILSILLVGQPFLMAVAKILILWYLYKKRDTIVSILTANRVSRLSSRLTNRLSGVGNRFSNRVQENALSKLRLASTAGKETMSGALKIGSRKVGQQARRMLKGFNPTTEPDVNHIRDVERRDGQYDIESYRKEGIQRTTVEGFKDIGRNLSSFKHRVQGTVKKVRSEGIKDKDSQDYKLLRTEAEQHLAISQVKKSKALGYQQRLANQETKERLMKQRSERSRVNAMRPYQESFSHETDSAPLNPSLNGTSQVMRQSVPTHDKKIFFKEEPKQERSFKPAHLTEEKELTLSIKGSSKFMSQSVPTHAKQETIVTEPRQNKGFNPIRLTKEKELSTRRKDRVQDSPIERLNPKTGDFNKPYITEERGQRIKGRLNRKK